MLPSSDHVAPPADASHVTDERGRGLDRLVLSPHAIFSLPAAVAVGLLLRVFMIGSKSLWLDEAVSLQAAQAAWADWPAGKADLVYPPLYFYGFLQHWMRLGQSESLLRLSSALFGVLAIPLAYVLARSLAGKSISLSTAWLVALSPLLVWYSQELRPYSLLVALALLSSAAFVRLLIGPHAGWWLVYVAATAAALYTHYYAVLLLPIQFVLLLAVLAQRRTRGAGLLAALAAWPFIVAAYWPWLKTQAAANFFLFVQGTARRAGGSIGGRVGVGMPSLTLLAGLISAAGLVLILAVWLLVRSRGLWPAIYRARGVRLVVLIAYVALLIVSVWPRGYAVKQAAVIGFPFVCLVIAWFWPLEGRPSRCLAALLLLSAAASLVNVVVIPKEQWRQAVEHVSAAYQPGDAIWITPGYDNLPFDYYNRGRLPVTEIAGPQDANIEQLAASHARLWLVYKNVDTRYISPGAELERQLGSRLRLADVWSAYRIRAVLFTPQ